MEPTFSRFQMFIEQVTFGLQIHYLLKVIILQFSTLYLAYIFAYPLSIPVVNQSAFQIGYSVIAVGFVIIAGTFIRDMCLRSFNPRHHHRLQILGSIIGYLLVSMTAVVVGYLLLIALSTGKHSLSTSDWVLGGFFSTASSALLAVGYHERLESIDHPDQPEIRQVVIEWENAMEWAELDDGTLEKEKKHKKFEEKCDQLSELLLHAKTINGEKLASEYGNWLNNYREHEPLGKEIVINGQSDEKTKNEELDDEHKDLVRLQRQLASIAQHEI